MAASSSQLSERLTALLRHTAGADEAAFRSHALRHEVAPLLAGELFADALAYNAQHMLQLTAQLFDVLDTLERAGVAALPFKGPSLAWSLYDSPALRPSCDLDVLIQPADVDAAIDALEAAGFRSEYNTDRRLYHAYRHYPLERPGCNLEIHWALMPIGHAFGGDPHALFRRAAITNIGGRDVRTLCDEDLLPYLCMHAGKHRWDKLKWLVDIERIVTRKAASIDWPRLFDHARAEGCHRALSVGLTLARDVLAAPLPREAERRLCNVSALIASIDWSRDATRRECVAFQLRCADLRRLPGVAVSFLRPTPTDAPDGATGITLFGALVARARRLLTRRPR